MSIDAKRIGLLPLTSRLDPTTLGYQTVHDPALRADMRDLSDSAKEFTEMYRLKMTTARFDPALVFEALEVYEDIHAKAMLIRSFADLAFAENT